MIILLIYGGALLAIVAIAALFYGLAVQSRRNYTCPNCGERYRMEHLEASHCNSCGTPLDHGNND